MADGERSGHPARFAVPVAVAALAATLLGLAAHLPAGAWWEALRHPDLDDTRQLLIAYSFLPRLATSLLAGAALALAGTVFQQVLRNPIADPTTLGISAGASLALTLSLAFAPTLLAEGREWVALAGASIAALAVFGIAARRDLAPLALVLAGMVVSLFCGALAAGVQLLDNGYTRSIYLWGAGSLAQQDWSVALYLLPRVAVSFVLVILLARPLALLGLDDASARGLGLGLRLLAFRVAALTVAVALSGFVVSGVGVIGFVGLAAPVLARLAGARRLTQQLIWSPSIGAALLCLADQGAQQFNGDLRETLPTGAATALLGAPLLLWMLPRLGSADRPAAPMVVARAPQAGLLMLAAILTLAVAVFVSLHLGADEHGWRWSSARHLDLVLRWRAPRLVGAMAAGAMLAMSGTLLQRMTGNPLASPEILGISAGATLGMILVVVLAPDAPQPVRLAASAVGALATLALILFLGRRMSYAPERILLAGLMIATLSSCLMMVFSVSGNPQLKALQSWLAGGTDQITQGQARIAAPLTVLALATLPLLKRWLDILPLGSATARAVGVDVGRARLVLLVGVAISTAGAALFVGPMGFVGLLGPHLARMMGFTRSVDHLFGAAILGALIMAVADWLGRVLLFPYQAPAGLIATLIGTPYLVWLLARRAHS